MTCEAWRACPPKIKGALMEQPRLVQAANDEHVGESVNGDSVQRPDTFGRDDPRAPVR